MVKVYVMVVDYFEDDYKRSEGYSEIIGVKTHKLEAYKTVIEYEYNKNKNLGGENDDNYKKEFEKLKKLTENNIESFYDNWESVREKMLGEPEFGSLYATGYRGKIKECDLELS